jgi:hypothetical protein
VTGKTTNSKDEWREEWLTNAIAAQLNALDRVQLYELISQVKFLTRMD